MCDISTVYLDSNVSVCDIKCIVRIYAYVYIYIWSIYIYIHMVYIYINTYVYIYILKQHESILHARGAAEQSLSSDGGPAKQGVLPVLWLERS